MFTNVTELKSVREKLGLTQSEFAQKLGVSRNYIALMETGRRNVPEALLQKAQNLVNNEIPEALDSRSGSDGDVDWKSRAVAAEEKLRLIRAQLRSFIDFLGADQE